MANIGWYLRYFQGAPDNIEFYNFQIPRNFYVVLVIKYPKTTEFNIRIHHRTWGDDEDDPLEEVDYTTVTTPKEDLLRPDEMHCPEKKEMCNITGGIGPAWHFDRSTGYLYLRMVVIGCYHVNTPPPLPSPLF